MSTSPPAHRRTTLWTGSSARSSWLTSTRISFFSFFLYGEALVIDAVWWFTWWVGGSVLARWSWQVAGLLGPEYLADQCDPLLLLLFLWFVFCSPPNVVPGI